MRQKAIFLAVIFIFASSFLNKLKIKVENNVKLKNQYFSCLFTILTWFKIKNLESISVYLFKKIAFIDLFKGNFVRE